MTENTDYKGLFEETVNDLKKDIIKEPLKKFQKSTIILHNASPW